MSFVIVSVCLFGFIHPGSKLILESGLPLSYFCVLFVLLRLFATPILSIIQKKPLLFNRSQVVRLLFMGIVGCVLQFSEFKGIEQGLPPNMVTFFMFSFPIWLTIFNIIFHRKISPLQFLKSFLILIGLFLLTGGQFFESQTSSILFPIISGFCLALWITMSEKLAKKGVHPLNMALYYDLFSFIALVLLFNDQLLSDSDAFYQWLTIENAFAILSFSLVFGLLPNLLFYKGSQFLSSVTSGGLMSFEPMLSTIYSFLLWPMEITPLFWIGAVFVLIGNLPFKIYLLFKNQLFFYTRRLQ